MSYKHITVDDRLVITTLINEQRTNSYIANRVGVNRSTIGREILRNQQRPKPQRINKPVKPAILSTDCRHARGKGLAQDKYQVALEYNKRLRSYRRRSSYYQPRTANNKATIRRSIANKTRTKLVYGSHSWLEVYVRDKLIKEQWSPDQIAGDIRVNHHITIYPQTIYDYIYLCPDKKELVKHLRRGNSHYRHKHGTNARIKTRRAKIPSIHQRPMIVEQRIRVGDLEGDTIVGLDQKDRIVTHVDRSSGECNLGLLLRLHCSEYYRYYQT